MNSAMRTLAALCVPLGAFTGNAQASGSYQSRFTYGYMNSGHRGRQANYLMSKVSNWQQTDSTSRISHESHLLPTSNLRSTSELPSLEDEVQGKRLMSSKTLWAQQQDITSDSLELLASQFSPLQPHLETDREISVNHADEHVVLNSGVAVRELIIIDANVPDKPLFYQQLKPGVDIVEFVSDEDGLAQLTATLQQYHNLEALHIVSHGEDGTLLLGNSKVDRAALENNLHVLAVMDSALVDGADVMLYGCDVAKSSEGEKFLELLSKGANVDVAASNDLTGNSSVGGDWELEVRTGDLAVTQLFDTNSLSRFPAVLSSVEYTSASFCSPNDNSEACGDPKSTHTSSDTRLQVSGSADVYAYTGWLYLDANNQASGSLTVEANSSELDTFRLTGLEFYSYSGYSCSSVSVTGYYSGGTSSTSSVSLQADTTTPIDVSEISNLNLSSFKIDYSGCDNLLFINLTKISTADHVLPSSNSVPTLSNMPTDISVRQSLASNVDLSAVEIADDDGGTITLTLVASTGNFTASSAGGVTASPNGTSAGTITLSGTSANLNTYLDTASNIQYTSLANVSGDNAASFTLKANDGEADSAISTVNIDVATNSAPTASNVSFSGTLQVGQLLTGSYDYADAESDTESGTTYKWYASENTSGANKAAISGATSSTYTLTADELGKYISFEVTPSDAQTTGSAVESSINSTAVVTDNVSPSFNDGASVSLVITEDDSLVAINDLLDVSDTSNGQTLTWSVTSAPSKGSLSGFATTASSGSTNITPTNLTYTPTANVSGSDSFTIQVSDGVGGTASITVNVTITPENDVPIVSNVAFSGILKVGELLTGSYSYSDIESDAESGTTFKWYTSDNVSGANKTAISGATSSTYTLTTIELDKYISFEVTPNDGTAFGSSVESSISGTAVATDNVAPSFNGGETNSLVISEDASSTAINSLLSVSDTSAGQTLTWSVVVAPTKGSVSGFNVTESSGTTAITPSGLTYTPSYNETGSDSFTVQVSDGAGGSDSITINVTINTVNDSPTLTATSQNPTFTEGNSSVTLFSAAEADTIEASQNIDGLSLTVTNVTDGVSEKLTIDGTSVVLEDGESGTTGGHSLNYSVSLTGTTATVSLTGGSLSVSELQTLVDGISYENTDNAPSTTNRIITITEISETGTENPSTNLSIASTVSVEGVNDDPTITMASTLSTDEDNNQTLSFSYSDVDGDTVTATEKSAPSHGQIAINGTDIVYTPTANYNGNDSFTITLTDGNGYTVDKTINVTVSSVNDEPSITVASTLTTDEDNNQTLSFSYSDVDGDTVTATEKSAPSHGQIAISGMDIVYTPTANYNGSDSFTITLTDGNGYTVDKTINVTVSSVNDEPSITIASTLTTDEDNNQTLSFNFSDADGDTVTATEKSAPSNGEIVISGTDIVYTPTANYNGSDSFTITLTDGNGYTVDKTINVTVSSVNDEPSITIASTLTTDEDNNQTLSFNFSDADGDTVTATEKSAPSHGEIAISGTDIVYTPTANYNGSDSFTITLTDGNGYTVNKTINVTVSSVNDEPSITIASTLTTDEDNNQTLSFNFSDVDGDTVTATEKSAPSNGQIAISGTDIVYTPTANYNGSDSFTITLTDGNGYTVDKTINVTVSSVNDEPSITIASTLTTDEDNNQTLSFNFSDADGDTVTVTEKSAPSHGQIAISGTDIVYTPTTNYHGSDSFTITLTDGNGYTVDKTINVTVSSVNDEPSITIVSTLTTDEDNNQTLSFNFSDVDGDTVTATEKSAPSHGEIAISGTDIVYTPTANYNGSDSFTITLTDGNGYTVDKTINVTVSSINDEPSITIASTLTTDEDNNQTLSFNFSDVDGDTVTATERSAPSHGEIAISGTDIVYTPIANYNGSDSFTITLTDESGYTVDRTINVQVTSVNDDPVVTGETLTFAATAQGLYSFAPLANDMDPDDDTLTLAWARADSGTLTVNGDSIDLQTADVGVVTIKYGVKDGNDAEVIGEAVLEIVASDGPTVTAPYDVEINASALFTKVDLGVATAIDSSGQPLPVVIENSDGFFTPGVHKVAWAATDQSGHTGKSLQTITVHPLISIEKDGKTVEGTEHQVAVYLNGRPSSYPVVIPYTAGGTMDTQDHDLVSGEVVITSGLEGVIDFEIFSDDVADSEETLIITLSDTVNLGSKYQYVLTVYEVNVAPDVTLQVIQNNEPRTVISPQQGTVTITAMVDDVNPGDSHQYRWINDNSALANISQTESVFEFDPTALTDGVYELAIEVTDSGNETVNTSVFLEVIAELATLGEQDTDGDLIPDNQEGYSDSDGDGIPDFQDAIAECNVIQSYASESSSYLVEGEPGVCLRKGVTVADGMTGGALLLEQELPVDEDATNVGGVFDYVAIGLPIPGQSYSLVLPQSRPIPLNAVYRKYSQTNGWVTLANDGTDPDNYVSSAPGFEGYCPPPGDSSWQQGQLIEGHWCVQLTIKDGGIYDDDGEANGRIVDPGGVATTSSNTLPQAEPDEATVVRGGIVTINVLANDNDGDGDALQVTSASSQLGSVSIENNQLVYQAPADFFGVDTLSYGISDGNGGTAFSNVSVNVNLASNDVVRNSSSGGSIGGWLVMILAVFGAIRAGKVRVSTVLLGLLTAFNVNADWFLKADIGQARADERNYDNNPQVLSVQDRDTAWLLGIGYRYNQDWAVSVNYINLGKGSAELEADVIQSPEDYHRTVAKVTPALGHGIGLDVDYTLWENDKVSLNGIAGALAWRTEFESEYQGQKIESTEDGIDPYIAFTLKGKLSSNVMLGAKVSRYFIRLNDVTTYSAIVEYQFGDQ